MVSKEKESSNWTEEARKTRERSGEGGGSHVHSSKNGRGEERGGEGSFEERTWYNY